MQQIIDYYDHEMKSPKRIYNLRNDKKHGKYIEFYRNSTIHKLKYFRDGIPVSQSYEYYDEGELRTLINYSDGKKYGFQFVFFRSGVLSKQFYFNKEGKLHGKYITFFENKQVRSIYHFKDGLPFLKSKHYFANGNLKKLTNYNERGTRTGVCKKYYENQTLKSSKFYRDGKLNGITFDYYENGNLQESFYHINGLLYGVHFMYDCDGNICKKTDYLDDKKNGYETVSKKGIIIQSRRFLHGNLEGKSFFYDDFGNLELNLTFVKGKLDGYQYYLKEKQSNEFYTISNYVILSHRLSNHEAKNTECSICYEKDCLWQTECSHTICISCVDSYYRKYRKNKTCFYCRKPFQCLDASLLPLYM